MKCSKCNNNDASYFISHESANAPRIGFCDSCAEEIGIFSALRRVESLLHGYGLKPGDNPLISQGGIPIEFAEKCKTCGTDIQEFERRFFFGCEDCAKVFGSIIANYLSVLGVSPGAGAYPGPPPGCFNESSRYEKINRKINKALENEDYAGAAAARDELEKLEKATRKRRKSMLAFAREQDDHSPVAGDKFRSTMLNSPASFNTDPGKRMLACLELKRNFSDFKFPTRLRNTEMDMTRRYATGLMDPKFLSGMKRVPLSSKKPLELKAFEARLLGRKLYPGATVLGDNKLARVVLFNNLDHLTLISITSEKNPAAALRELKEPLRKIEDSADIAYTSRFGYLTAMPRHLGCGLSVSTFLHLPYSLFRGRTYAYPGRNAEKSIRFEPLIGSNSEQHGFFRISSTIGFSRAEEEIVAEVFGVTDALIEEEEKIRAEFAPSERKRMEKIIKKVLHHTMRSYRLSFLDVLRFTSFVLLAIDLGILTMPDFELSAILPGLTSPYIMFADNKRYTVNECEKRRADLLAEMFENWLFSSNMTLDDIFSKR